MAGNGIAAFTYQDYVKQLSMLLQDRYRWDGDGFTILKELIQNANDAKAKVLHFGYCAPLLPTESPLRDGEAPADHPLLTVPALFAVNDGPFTEADSHNIRRLGSNSKAGDAATAGRFGLGLKSVFHLCEAFFYLASPFPGGEASDGLGNRVLCQLLNPWSPDVGFHEEGPYDDWDLQAGTPDAQRVQSLLLNQLQPVVGSMAQWFCVWIPLRDPKILRLRAITKRPFDLASIQKTLLTGSVDLRLAQLLPLMSSLSGIHVWRPKERGQLERMNSAEVDEPESTRPPALPEQLGDRLPTSRRTKFGGAIRASSATEDCRFAGCEQIAVSARIQGLWNHKSWPDDDSFVTNRHRQPHRARLAPHGAVRFLSTPRGKSSGKLTLRWCVFLPLGTDAAPEKLQASTSLNVDVSIYLHGYFFIDSGRNAPLHAGIRSVVDGELTEEQLRLHWNQAIEDDAIWPVFLDAFASFIDRMKWSDSEIDEFTRCVRDLLDQLSQENDQPILPTVCAKQQWIRRLNASRQVGTLHTMWTLISAKNAIYEIPTLSADLPLFDLLPRLTAMAADHSVTFVGSARLTHRTASKWPANILVGMIESLDVGLAFSSARNLEYFARLLECCAVEDDQVRAVGPPLVKILRTAFRSSEITLQQCREMKSPLARVIRYVPAESLLFCEWTSTASPQTDELFRHFALSLDDLLPVPSEIRDLLSSKGDCRIVPSSTVVRLLTGISALSLDAELLGSAVGKLLNQADLDRTSLSGALANLRLIEVQDLQAGHRKRVTWSEFYAQRRCGLAYSDLPGLTSPLQAALGGAAAVWRIKFGFAEDVLGRQHDVPVCSLSECAVVLSPRGDGRLAHLRGPELAGWSERQALLEKLQPSLTHGSTEQQSRMRNACRLLIHGQLAEAGNQISLFLSPSAGVDPLAERLVRQTLGKMIDPESGRTQDWRIIAGEPAGWAMGNLSPQSKELLQIPELRLSNVEVLKLLEGASTNPRVGLPIEEDDYVELLERLSPEHNGLLKRLPIHPTTSGQRIAILEGDSSAIYWDDGYALDSDLLDSTVLLRLHRSANVRKIQLQLAKPLGPEAVIETVFRTDDPSRWARGLLKALGELEQAPTDHLESLSQKPWIPTAFGPRGRGDLICLTLPESTRMLVLTDDLRRQIERMSTDCGGAFVPDWMIDGPVLKQLSAPRVRQRLFDWRVFPETDDSLRHLGLLLAEDPTHRIGRIPPGEFSDWLSWEWDADLMPSHALLKAVATTFGDEHCFEHASSEIREPIEGIWRLVDILTNLATSHERATTQARKSLCLRVYSRYLDFLVQHHEYGPSQHLGCIRLLSQAGTWKLGSELCQPPAEGIAKDSVLEVSLAAILAKGDSPDPALPASDVASERAGHEYQRPPQEGQTDSADAIRQYFSRWEGHIPNDVIGGFLALLGRDPQMEKEASRHLGKRNLDHVRDELRVGDEQLKDHPRLKSLRARISVVSEHSAEKVSLTGSRFLVPLAADIDTILVGAGPGATFDLSRLMDSGEFGLRLRPVANPETAGAGRLTEWIKHAAHSLLADVYAITKSREFLQKLVDAVFEDLAKPDQLEIVVAQTMILENASLILSQLNLRSDPVIGSWIEKHTAFHRHRAERFNSREQFLRIHNKHDRLTERERNLQKSIEEGIDEEGIRELRLFLENDDDAQSRVLRAVRQRIQGHNQYNASAVPFELYQNADDASHERAELFRNATACDSLQIFLGHDRLAIRHFGRCVNQVPPNQDPRNHRFSDDLCNMLTLWLSSKSSLDAAQSGIELTGKFGLGFKSVFLIADRPRLLSGQIACEMLGGMYPRRIAPEERAGVFDHYLQDLDSHRMRQATVLELPFRTDDAFDTSNGIATSEASDNDGPLAKAERVVGRFLRLAPLLVAFGRQIREIEIRDDSAGTSVSTRWNEKQIGDLPHCFRGTIQPLLDSAAASKDESAHPAMPGRAIVLRASRHSGALLLAHDGRRFQPLPPDVPTIWVTAPTGEALATGFILNGKFSLDPGRARLGRESPENEKISREIGAELQQRFTELFRHRRHVGWRQFCQDAAFDGDADEDTVLDSLWELLGPRLPETKDKSDAAHLVRLAFWHPTDGAAWFLRQVAGVPTRLKGAADHGQHVTLDSLKISVRDCLESDDGFSLMCVRSWPAFRRKLGDSHPVSETSVAKPIRQLAPEFATRISVVSLPEILQWEVPDKHVSPTLAAQLGELIHPQDQRLGSDRAEEQRIRDVLGTFWFQNCQATFVKSEQLIIGHRPPGAPLSAVPEEELRRAALAPPDRVLNGSYDAKGIAFFRECRGRRPPQEKELAEWILRASTNEARQAAREYLAEGELRQSVQDEIRARNRIQGTWLEELAESPEFQCMTLAQQGQLFGLIPEPVARQIVDSAIAREPAQQRVGPNSTECLRRIHDWWMREGTARTKGYEQRIYPSGRPQHLSGERTPAHRKDWVILLLLGLTHTMGRSTAESHRNFLRNCERDGKLDMIASSERDPSRWMNWIDRYLDDPRDDGKFAHWMRQFVGFYQVSRHLDVYISAFDAVERMNGPFELTAITSPLSSPEFQGGGFEAPTLKRMLGIGQCFVMRELVRLGVLSNPLAHPHCYVPVKRVRNLLAILGCGGLNDTSNKWQLSKIIYRFLSDRLDPDRATFGRAFDIPFQLISENSDLQEEFLDEPIEPSDDENDPLIAFDESAIERDDL